MFDMKEYEGINNITNIVILFNCTKFLLSKNVQFLQSPILSSQ